MTILEALNIAMKHHKAGRLDQAEGIYRQVLAQSPGNVDALHLLGLVENLRKNYGAAEILIRRAIAICPDAAALWADLSMVFMNQESLAECYAACRKALALEPGQYLMHHFIGLIQLKMKRYAEAIEAFGQANRLEPECLEAWMGRMAALQESGRLEEALELSERLTAARPDSAAALNNHGNILAACGRIEEGIDCLKRAISLDPNFAQAHNNLGSIYGKIRRNELAAACFAESIRLNPSLRETHNNLGNALKSMMRYDEALACYRKALELSPLFPEAHNNLGNLYKDMGQMDLAIKEFERSTALSRSAENHSNLIFAMHYHPGYGLKRIGEELGKWNETFAAGLNGAPAVFPTAGAEKLRIGFVSEDLRAHPVGRFMIPLLENLDRERFFTACYSDALVHDAVSRRLSSRVDLWVQSASLSHQRLDERIRADGMHILIDLAAHTAGNRLLTFARKPAPAQMTWLGYCGSTGLTAMDYRISDRYMDPPGMFDAFHTEKTLRLRHTYWCYPAPPETDRPGAPPCLKNGFVTYGCLNNFCKISPGTLSRWVEILRRVSGSRLRVHAGEGSCRARFLAAVESGGVDASRVGFQGYLPQKEYFNAYNEIDVTLDPFPYNGGTTSCDSIWMGVPLVALEGDRPVGRAGLSILSNLGMGEWAARSEREYVELAVQLGQDAGRLGEMRRTLRDRMMASPLMDAPGFAADFSELLESAWAEIAGGEACRS